MKIDVESLVNAVQEHFDNVQSYAVEGKKKPWYCRNDKEKRAIEWHERNEHGTANMVHFLVRIFNTDYQKLYTIARVTRNWEKKHHWEKCFPVKDHEQQIMKYLQQQ